MSTIVGGPHSQGVSIQGIADQYYNTELRLTPEERALVLKYRAEAQQRIDRTVSIINDALSDVLDGKVHDHIPNWPGTNTLARRVYTALSHKGLLKE